MPQTPNRAIQIEGIEQMIDQAKRVSAHGLRQFIERVERLNAEKADISDATKEVFAGPRGRGHDAAVIRKIIARRNRSSADLAEVEAVFDLCEQVFGGPQ